MTSRFELWNNLHRAMTPLAHWYALIDNEVILELQNKVIHEVLYNRYCLIKWAPMHEVTMLRKLLSHIFEQYTDVQDDGYTSDEDIEEYPETFMPRPRIMPMGLQEVHNCSSWIHCTFLLTATLNKDLNRASAKLGGYCSHQNLNQRMNQCHWMTSTLRTKVCTSQMTLDWLDEPSLDRHLCIHDEHQDRCEHFRAPSRLDHIVTYENPAGFMSLQDLEDMNILADIEFSSDDELPDLI